MQNPTSPAVTLQIAGSSFDLVFDFEAIADAEEITGRPLLTGLRRRDIESPSINLVRAMLFRVYPQGPAFSDHSSSRQRRL